MRTIALLLLLAAVPALSEIRSDQPLTPPVIGAAPSRQESARVASDGTNFFAVWRMHTSPTDVVIGGGRLSPAGELLDRPSLFFAAGRGDKLGDADVVFVGGNFLVAYQSGSTVVIRIVSRDGRPLNQPVVISNSGMHAWLATNGKTVFLVTAFSRFRLLAPDGTPLGPEHDISNVSAFQMSVASNGDRYLIVGGGPLHGVVVLLSSNGDYLGAQSLPFDVPQRREQITTASNGSSFLVTLAANGPVACFHVDADGHPGALQTIDKRASQSVAVSWSGNEYTLVWTRTLFYDETNTPLQDIAGARVDAAGMLLDTVPVVIASLQTGRSGAVFGSASNGLDTMIITADTDRYRDWRTTAAIFKSLPQIDAEPASRRRAPIASSAPEQTSGSIASNGTLSLVAWRERSGLEQAVVRGAFIAADGQLSAPFSLGNADSLTPTVTASNGRDFLVSYVDSLSRLVARRLTLEGALDPVPIVMIPHSPYSVDALAAAWSGQAYVVVTAAGAYGGIAAINSSGIATSVPQLLSDSGFASADAPAISCAASTCSVTWHWTPNECFSLCPGGGPLDTVARTDGAGNILSHVTLTYSPDITPARSLAAADGTSMFVYSNGTTMFAGRITAEGLALDTLAGRRVITSQTSFALLPVAVVGNGLYFVEPDDATTGRLYWTRFDSEPAPHVTSLVNLHQSISIPIGFSETRAIPLTASARNTYLVYSRGEDDAALMAPRLFLRTLASPDPQPSLPRKRAAR